MMHGETKIKFVLHMYVYTYQMIKPGIMN